MQYIIELSVAQLLFISDRSIGAARKDDLSVGRKDVELKLEQVSNIKYYKPKACAQCD